MDPSIRSQAVLLVDEKSRPPVRVTGCSRRARQQGVRVGMPVAEARSLLRGPVVVREHDPLGDRDALKRLACFCERFSPIVSLEEGPAPSGLLLDMTGCLAVFKGPRALLYRVASDLEEQGLVARLALAETVGLAWGVARFGLPPGLQTQKSEGDLAASCSPGEWISPENTATVLRALPIRALRLSAGPLHLLDELGLQRVGDLERLARCEMGSRLGEEVLRRWDQAAGFRDEVLVPHRPAPVVEGSWALEHPTAQSEVLEAVFRRVLDRLLPLVECRGEGILRLHFVLTLTDSPPHEGELELVRVSVQREHFVELWRLQLERRELASPVSALKLRVTTTGRLEIRQQELFEASSVPSASWERVIDRLSNRLGAEQVARVRFRADIQPERACRYEAWVKSPSRKATLTVRHGKGAVRAPRREAANESWDESWLEEEMPDPSVGSNRGWHRPIRLSAEPLAIEVLASVPDGPPVRFHWEGREHRVRGLWGPERLETGWWRGPFLQRDYYQVETEEGSRYWLFRRRDEGTWFLHGWFD